VKIFCNFSLGDFCKGKPRKELLPFLSGCDEVENGGFTGFLAIFALPCAACFFSLHTL